MTTEVLGKLTFSQTPDVNGQDILLNAGGVPAILSGTTAERPAAGTGPVGRIYLDTTVNRFYRDDGAAWIDLTSVPLIDGTVNQIDVVDGTNISPSVVSLADNPVIPGVQGIVIPVGTTAQRAPAPATGSVRYNTTIARQEFFNGTFWTPLGQVLQVVTGSILASTGTTQIPFNATLPTATQGHQIWTQSFTPISATSRISVGVQITAGTTTAARTITMTCLNGTTTVGAASTYAATANVPYVLNLRAIFQPGSTATITISGRLGLSGTGTASCNQVGTATLAGALVSEYTIMEIA